MAYQAGGIVHCGMFLRDFGDVAVEGFTCLIQHLCFNTIGLVIIFIFPYLFKIRFKISTFMISLQERAENRSFRVMTIYRLLCLLPLEPYTDQLHWIVKLSKNSMPARRSLALVFNFYNYLNCIINPNI